MNQLSSIRQRLVVALVITVQIMGLSLFSLPLPAYATDTPPCPPVNGTSSPTGAASHTFTYNKDKCVWENAYYTWSPYTKEYKAEYDQTPVLNSDGTAYEHIQWDYSPVKRAYVDKVVSIPVPQPAPMAENGTQTAKAAAQPGASGASSQTTGGNSISGTGADSDNEINSSNTTNADINVTNNTSVLTTLDSNATSGNASVLQNTNGGSAATGDATAVANYLSLIQSGWNPTGGALATFNADLYGNFTGDMLFDPNQILGTGADSTNVINSADETNINVTVSDTASIENDIDLKARSGDATVSKNTNAGDATTGDATAIANLINMINSSINSSKGFIGNLNIHGDYVGDFLLPPALLAQLQTTGASSQNSINQANIFDADITDTNNSTITNNFDLSAQSGNAKVSGNTNAGDAITGAASTNVAQQNYVGANGNGQKGLLVFVNVLGKWVGFINPNFATIGNTGAGSQNTIDSSDTTDINLDITRDYSITNNIDVSAVSGDATVSKNTNAGDARTGDASAAVNVLNMIDSNLNFSDWFGVLFINVFGSWTGSFGVDTEAGGKGGQSPAAGTGATPGSDEQMFAGSATDGRSALQAYVASGARVTSAKQDETQMLSTSTDEGNSPLSAAAQTLAEATTASQRNFTINWWVLAVGGVIGVAVALRKQELDLVKATIGRLGRS